MSKLFLIYYMDTKQNIRSDEKRATAAKQNISLESSDVNRINTLPTLTTLTPPTAWSVEPKPVILDEDDLLEDFPWYLQPSEMPPYETPSDFPPSYSEFLFNKEIQTRSENADIVHDSLINSGDMHMVEYETSIPVAELIVPKLRNRRISDTPVSASELSQALDVYDFKNLLAVLDTFPPIPSRETFEDSHPRLTFSSLAERQCQDFDDDPLILELCLMNRLRDLKILRKFLPDELPTFGYLWNNVIYRDWSDNEVRNVCVKGGRHPPIEHYLALMEACRRSFAPDVLHMMTLCAIKYKDGKTKRKRGPKVKHQVHFPSRVARAPIHSSEDAPAPPMESCRLADFLFSSDSLQFGALRITTRDELLLLRPAFSRDKNIFKRMLSSPSLREWQSTISQKMRTDFPFAAKIQKILDGQPVLQGWHNGRRVNSSAVHDLMVADQANQSPNPQYTEYLTRLLSACLVEEDLVTPPPRVRGLSNLSNFNPVDEPDFCSTSVAGYGDVAGLTIQVGAIVTKLGILVNRLFHAQSLSERIQLVILSIDTRVYGEIGVAMMEFIESKIQPELQAGSATADDMLEETFALLGVSNVLGTFMEFLSAESFSFNVFDFLRKRFISLSKMHTGDDKIKNFWATFTSFLKTLKACMTTRSLDPLFYSDDPPARVLHEAECLATHRAIVTVISRGPLSELFIKHYQRGDIPKGWSHPFLASEYMEKVSETIERMDAIIPLVPVALSQVYRTARDRLFQIRSTAVDTFSANSFRTPPLGIALVGAPGVGKSELMKTLIHSVGAKANYPTDASAVYMWRNGVNFQDGLSPSHCFYIMDDIDISLTPPTRGVPDHVDAVMTVIDGKPFPIESAAVDQKGKNFGRPLLVLYGSNNVDLKLKTFIRETSAIKRRLRIKAVVGVNPLYKLGVSGVDFVKASEANDPDIHDIEVFVYNSSAGDGAAGGDYVKYKNMGDTEFIRFVGREFIRHLATHTDRMARATPLCAECKTIVPVGRHVCRFCEAEGLFNEPGATLNGGTASRVTVLADKTEALLDATTEVVVDARSKDVVGRMDRVLSQMDKAMNPNVAEIAAKVKASFTDFLLSPTTLGVGLITALIVALKVAQSQGLLQGRTNNSVQTPVPNFVRASTTKPADQPFRNTTYSKEQMVAALQANMALVRSDKEGDIGARCLRVGADLFVMPFHLLRDSATYRLEFRGRSYESLVKADNYAQIGSADLAILKVADVPAAPTALPYCWPSLESGITSFDTVGLVKETEVVWRDSSSLVMETSSGYTGMVVKSNFDTVQGDCGLPVIAECGGRYRVVGLHHILYQRVGIFASSSYTTAVVLTKRDIERAAARLLGTVADGHILQSCFPRGLDPKPLPPDTSSELALALVKGAEVTNLGFDPYTRGSSAAKSSCHLSPYYGVAEEWCALETGERHYFQVPKLKGAMLPVEGGQKWFSPYQNIFTHYKSKQDYALLYRAILDYTGSLSECDVTGYAMLSEDEAILGIENSSISSINFSTSVGPPLVGPKSAYFLTDGSMSPLMRESLDEIHGCLERGEIPIPLASCTLKDEPVKKSKNDLRDIRVFMCLPAPWNLVSKMYLAPIKLFMRNNKAEYESMVGTNITGLGASEVLNQLASVNPELDNIAEGDYTKMDKTINGLQAWGVVQVFKAIAVVLGLDAEKVGLLVWSNFHVVYSIKGDLYQVGGMNPSGSDITVEINAVVNSLAHRVAYFKSIGLPDMTLQAYTSGILDDAHVDFRTHNALITYGDDFLLAHNKRVDLQHLFSFFEPLGLLVTDGQKSARPVYRGIDSVYFLKRKFFREDGYVFAGLDRKSIFRMLMVFKKSSLSLRDHSAIALEEAMREIFLRRDMDFDVWRGRFLKLKEEHNLGDSTYLKLHEKRVYEEAWRDGSFSSWISEAEEAPLCRSDDTVKVIFQSFNMSTSLDIVPALGGISGGITPTSTTLVVGSTSTSAQTTAITPHTYGSVEASGTGGQSITHAVGDVMSSSGSVSVGGIGNRARQQPMARAEFGDYLRRAVLIESYSDFNSSSTLTFYPWKLWSAVPSVEDKLRHFNFITGGIRIFGVLEAPPLSKGLVIVTAMPTYEDGAGTHIPVSLCMVGEHAVLDMSSSCNFEMVLPWNQASNWGNLTDNDFSSCWKVTVRTLDNLVTSIPEGCATAMLRIFAVPCDDFELSGPIFQSGRASVRSGRGTTLSAPAAASMPMSASQAADPGGVRPKILDRMAAKVVEVTGAKPSEWMASLGTASGLASLIPTPFAPYLATGGATLLSGAKVLDYFGWTRRTLTTPVEDAQIRVVSNLIHCDGMDPGRPAALFSTNAISTDQMIPGNIGNLDETALSFIYGKYTLMGALDYIVGDDDPPDYRLPITPNMIDNAGLYQCPTTAGYVGARFRHWRGDVKFLFYPVVSAVNRGALQFIWQPIPSSSTTTGNDYTNVSINTIISVEPATPIEINIGYNNDYPAADVDFYRLTSPVTADDYRTLNGYLRVRNLVPFTGAVCGQTIKILVFVAAGDNMEYFGPTDVTLFEGIPRIMDIDLTTVPSLQSGIVGADGQGMMAVDLVPSSGVYPIVENLAGEAVRSVRALIQKPSLHLPLPTLISGDTNKFFTDDGVIDLMHGPFDPLTRPSNYFAYFGSMYLGYAGSVRSKIIILNSVNDTQILGGRMMVAPCQIPEFVLGQAQMTRFEVSEFNPIITDSTVVSDVLLPYYHQELYVPAYKAHLRSDTVMFYNKPVGVLGMWYKSAGPDARLSYFRAQNFFSFALAPMASDFEPLLTFTERPGGRSSETQSSTGETREERWYRARTGRATPTESPEAQA